MMGLAVILVVLAPDKPLLANPVTTAHVQAERIGRTALFAPSLLLPVRTVAQTQLFPGDIAIIQYRTDNTTNMPEGFGFVVLADIAAGTSLKRHHIMIGGIRPLPHGNRRQHVPWKTACPIER
jgi:hypothetical protein